MRFNKSFPIIMIFVLLVLPQAIFAALTCTVSASCADTVIFHMSDSTNAHGEISSGSDYLLNSICCSGVSGLGNSCSGNFQVAAKLESTTNSHIEQGDQANYANNVCISSSNGADVITVAYQDSNCTGYDTTLASISDTTNAHVGDASAYTRKICATVGQTSITFTNDDAAIGFGTLTPSNARYATADALGSGSDTTAHTLAVTTSASGGYTLTYSGPTLTSGGNTIAAATITSDANGTPGAAQFALGGELTGTGTMATGYNNATPDWKFTPNATTTLATSSGPAASASVAVHYLANISTVTPPGAYANTITFIATGNF